MNNRSWVALVCVVGLFLPAGCTASTSAERPPAVAGRFYPADPVQLETAVRAFLRDAKPPRGERPLVIVVPHAGYLFSGQIAADAFRQTMDFDYDVVVILGTNHSTPGLAGVALYDGDAYRTPLGPAEVDKDLVRELIALDPLFKPQADAHAGEHSVEVEVPFVQIALPGVKIVPAIVGSSDPEAFARAGRALARALAGRRSLIVASSDLSHYPAYDDALISDRAVLAAMAGGDPAALQRVMDTQMKAGRPGLSTCACGEAPVSTAMEAARSLGAGHGIVLSYANSGNCMVGERSRVVGYGAVMFAAGTGPADLSALAAGETPSAAELSSADGKALLDFARETIRRYLLTTTTPLPRDLPPGLSRPQGVFVTLKKQGELRGCIGHTVADLPLGQVVGSMALQAAFNDPRFSPLEQTELDEITIDVSLLSPLVRVKGPDDVVLGRDGVSFRKDGHTGLFLPEVAVEQGWNREQLMNNLCRKAGLPEASWRKGGELYTFTTTVLHERANP